MIFQNRSKLRGLVGRIGVAVATSSPRDAQIGRFWKIVYREHANTGATKSCARVRAYRSYEQLLLYLKREDFAFVGFKFQYHPLRAGVVGNGNFVAGKFFRYGGTSHAF